MMEELAKMAAEAEDCALEAYKDLAQPSTRIIGKSLGTTLEFLFTPFTWLQLVNEKTKANIQHRLRQYEERLKQLPEEKRCEVHPELGVPILQRLSYTTNDDVAEMFVSLLVSASNVDTISIAHPSFISIIEKLSPDEARILLHLYRNYLNRGVEYIPYMKIRATPLNKVQYQKGSFEELDAQLRDVFTFTELENWLTMIPSEMELEMPEMIRLYWANLVGCGLIEDQADLKNEGVEDVYAAIEKASGLQQLQEQLVPGKYSKVYCSPSTFRITELGKHFIDACVKKSTTEE